LLFTASNLEHFLKSKLDLSRSSQDLGGMEVVLPDVHNNGFCTFMKTVEVTRHKTVGERIPSTWSVARDILRQKGSED